MRCILFRYILCDVKVSCNSVKNGLIYILYGFMYMYVCDIVCRHETLINY